MGANRTELRARVTLATALVTLLSSAAAAHADLGRWTMLSQYPGTLPVRAIAFNPQNSAIVYAAVSNAGVSFGGPVDGAGVFKSVNGGTSFAFAIGGLTDLRVAALVVDPLTPATVYAATAGSGVFKTVDAAASWSAASTGLPPNAEVNALALDPSTPSTLYAGLNAGGVYKSTDGAASWVAASSGIPANLAVQALVVDALDPSNVYAGTNARVYRSTDAGASWQAGGNMTYVRPHDGANASSISVTAIVLAPGQSQTLYAAVADGGGVFRSDDMGASWSPANDGLDGRIHYAVVLTLLIDPADSSTLYVGTYNDGGVFRSTDAGAHWHPLNGGNLASSSVYELAADHEASPTIFAGTYQGAIHSLAFAPLNLDHYRCFKAKGTPLPDTQSTLVDVFETRTTAVRTPKAFCEPVNVNAQGVLDADTYLTCYAIKGSGYDGDELVMLDNQLVQRGFNGIKPTTLCVPSQLQGSPAALDVGPFKEYRIKRRLPGRDYALSLEGSFGTQSTKFFDYASGMTPVEIDGIPPSDTDAHLTCLRIRKKPRNSTVPVSVPPPDFSAQDVIVENVYGTQTLRLVRPERYCTPSLRTYPTP